MGQKLLSVNDSLKQEKEFYRTQLEVTRKNLNEATKTVCELGHEVEDLKIRNARLLAHLTSMEASNEQAMKRVAELEEAAKKLEIPTADAHNEKAKEKVMARAHVMGSS
jgi:predicted RNase H-like nuclease (RuvC/YqgF family)